jgi:DNA-directed RNA polymerase specialized sigma24 family protein
MDEHDVLAERFEAHRTRLRAVAYQTLGSTSEADDAVQEAWLRLSRSDSDNIENLGGWLTTVVARVCMNMLQSRRERPVGVHLSAPATATSARCSRHLAQTWWCAPTAPRRSVVRQRWLDARSPAQDSPRSPCPP